MFSITIPTISSNGELIEFKLNELLAALKTRSLDSRWLCSGVECLGAAADELMEYASYRAPIAGEDLFKLSRLIDQTLAGVFEAFDKNKEKPWLKIRVVRDTKIEFYSPRRSVLSDIAGLYPQAEQMQT